MTGFILIIAGAAGICLKLAHVKLRNDVRRRYRERQDKE